VWRRFLLVALVGIAAAAGAAAGANPSPIRVTLTAQNHHPRASHSPSVHWSYCVKVTTAAGVSVASKIRIQVVSGRTVRRIAVISLREGYNHWCQGIGGEAGILNTLPIGRKLIFQAVVAADGVTVKRNWPIIVRRAERRLVQRAVPPPGTRRASRADYALCDERLPADAVRVRRR